MASQPSDNGSKVPVDVDQLQTCPYYPLDVRYGLLKGRLQAGGETAIPAKVFRFFYGNIIL